MLIRKKHRDLFIGTPQLDFATSFGICTNRMQMRKGELCVMKRNQFTWILAFLLVLTPFLSSGQDFQAAAEETASVSSHIDKWSIVSETEDAPEIDGMLDDPVWEEANNLTDFATAYANEILADEAAVKLAYDEDNLYIGIDYQSEEEEETLVNVDLILSPANHGEEYFRIPVEIRDIDKPFVNNWGPAQNTVPNVQTETQITDGHVTAEVMIPLDSLGVDEVTAGEEWRFNAIAQHELGTTPLSSWVPIRTSFYNDTGLDTISFTGKVTDEGRVGSLFMGALPEEEGAAPIVWDPEQLSLLYTGFTEKQLTFEYEQDIDEVDIQLKWKTPSGNWESLNDVQINKEDNQFQVDFQHPEPLENGQYDLQVVMDQGGSQIGHSIVTFDRHGLIKAGDETFNYENNIDVQEIPAEPASEEVQKVLDIIPENVGFIFTGIPDQSQLKPAAGNFTWSPEEPWTLRSDFTDLTYPNEEYPEDQKLTVKNGKGDIVEYPYHEDEDGNQYFLTAHIWYKQKDYTLKETANIAKEDPLGAARLLYRFAEVYEGYVPTNDYIWHQYPIAPTSGPPYAYWGGMWNRWSVSELVNFKHLANAYELLKETNALEVLSDEMGEDVERRIVDDMLKPSVEFLRTFAVINTNMDYNNWIGLINMGKALDDPSYVHEAVEKLEDYAMSTYLFDGFFKETTISYHNQSTNGINQTITNLAGWTDPEGYISPRTGKRFENLDMGEKFPALKKAGEIPNLVVYPDGKVFPAQETWANEIAGNPMLNAGSFLLPASGISRLARGVVTNETNDYYGINYDFTELEIIAQSVEHKLYATNGTLQLEAERVGESIQFAFEVPKTDTYDIDLKPFRAPSYGQYEVTIDGEKITDVDFYSGAGGADFENIGSIELTAGTHQISFEGIGKDDASTNYKMGLIQMALLDGAARQARDEEREPVEADPTQLYLTFQPKYGHNHWDPLNLALYDKGQELLPDIGYSHTFYRQWTASTLAHNTVVVDGADMDKSAQSEHGGNIDTFSSLHDNVQVIRANQETAYSQTDEYSREPWLIQFPDSVGNDGYVLDLFRVSGGDRQEYTLQGDANRDAIFETDLSLSDYGPYLLPEGVEVTEPESERDTGSAEGHYYGYIYVRDVKKADIADGKYNVTLATEEDGAEMAKMKITGLVEPGQNELFLGEAFSLRSTRLHGVSMDNNDEAVKYTMPKMVVRREGKDLTSQFITAMEPYAKEDTPRIENIEKLDLDESVEGDIAVKVTYGDTTDIILSSLHPDQPLVVDDMVLNGKMGMIRLIDGEVQDMYLFGGTTLEKGEVKVTDTGAVSGSVTEVERTGAGDDRDAFITDTQVPTDIAGNTLVITHPDGKTHGFEVKEIAEKGGQTVIEIADMDPGFSMDGDHSKMEFFPFTEWSGETTFRIENEVKRISVPTLLETLAENENEVSSESTYRVLKMHLTSLEHFEKQNKTDKVLKHMKSFVQLLDHHKNNESLSEKAHQILKTEAEQLIKQQ